MDLARAGEPVDRAREPEVPSAARLVEGTRKRGRSPMRRDIQRAAEWLVANPWALVAAVVLGWLGFARARSGALRRGLKAIGLG